MIAADDTELRKQLKEALHCLRLECRLTLSEVATYCDVSRSTAYWWDSGRSIPRDAHMNLLLTLANDLESNDRALLYNTLVQQARKLKWVVNSENKLRVREAIEVHLDQIKALHLEDEWDAINKELKQRDRARKARKPYTQNEAKPPGRRELTFREYLRSRL